MYAPWRYTNKWYTIGSMKALHLTRPHAIMMVGIPGSGKTFFASHFSDTFTTPYLNLDDIEQRSVDATAAGELTVTFLTELAKTEQTFVLEGNSATRTWRTEFAKWARAHGYVPLFVWTQVDQATALKRSLKSGRLDRDSFAEALRTFSAPHPDEKPIVISGKHTYASQARTVLNHLVTQNRPSSTPSPRRPSMAPVKPPRRTIGIQ